MMTWGDAYVLDDGIVQMLPSEYLRQRAWCVEVRYRDAVGNADAFDAFMASERSRLVDESEEHLRARVHNMVGEPASANGIETIQERRSRKSINCHAILRWPRQLSNRSPCSHSDS